MYCRLEIAGIAPACALPAAAEDTNIPLQSEAYKE